MVIMPDASISVALLIDSPPDPVPSQQESAHTAPQSEGSPGAPSQPADPASTSAQQASDHATGVFLCGTAAAAAAFGAAESARTEELRRASADGDSSSSGGAIRATGPSVRTSGGVPGALPTETAAGGAFSARDSAGTGTAADEPEAPALGASAAVRQASAGASGSRNDDGRGTSPAPTGAAQQAAGAEAGTRAGVGRGEQEAARAPPSGSLARQLLSTARARLLAPQVTHL